MAIRIRTAVPADSSALASLLGQLGYPAGPSEVEARFEYWLDDPHSALVIAEVEGAVAGVAALHVFPLFQRTSRHGRIVALVVDDALGYDDVCDRAARFVKAL